MKRIVPLICLSLACTCVPAAFAQATATLVGTVRDASGAVVPNAAIEVRNEDTGFVRTTTTNGGGEYTASLLPTGRYSVTGEFSGFRVSKVQHVVLTVDQNARVDLSLVAGANTEVTVSETPNLIQSETSSISQVIDNRKVLDLPLVSRNFVDLVSLTPGAITSDNVGGPTSGEAHGFTTAAIAGGQSSKTEFLLDGITNSEELFDGVQFTPSIDFLQEFRVQSNNFSAQYGRGSAVVNISTRAGTNQLHGAIFEFIRNDAVDAKNYFTTTNPPLRRNLFGATMGGPIFRNKLFFTLNYEGLRDTEPVQFTGVLTPSQRERAGDFSRSVSGQLFNPTNGQPYPNNQIPVDGAAAYLLKYFPVATGQSPQQPSNITDPTTASVYSRSSANTRRYDQGNARIDYTVSARDTLFGRFSRQDGNANNTGPNPVNGGGTAIANFRSVVIGETHVFTPKLLNELRVGYNHLLSDLSPQALGTNYTTAAGIQGFDQVSTTFPGFPNIGAGSYGLNGSIFSPLVNPTTTWNVIDTVTFNKGRHSVLAGIDLRRFHFTSTNGAWSRGFFSFGGNETGCSGGAGVGCSALADFVAGYPGGFNARSFPRDLFGERTFDFPLFVQDDWKLRDNLSLNLGLRYDLALAPTQDFSANSYFSVATGRWIVGTKNGKINTSAQRVESLSLANFSNYIVTAGQAGLSENLQTISKKNFAPRVGFAYRPYGGDKFVVRGGYGISYLLPRGNNTVTNAIVNVPFIFDDFGGNGSPAVFGPGGVPVVGKATKTATTENLFAGPYASGESLISAQDLNIRSPYNQQWNLAVQQDLGGRTALQLAYVGNRGTRLERDLPLNYATPDNPAASTSVGSRRPTGNPARANYNPGAAGGDNFTNSGNSFYHSLQATLERRSANGLNFLAAYTWAKLIDDSVEGSNDQDAAGTQNPLNLRLDRGRGQLDIAHRLVISYSYPLPFGRGQAYLSSLPRPVDLAIGGWKLSGIAQFQSGSPFSVFYDGDSLNVGGEYNHRATQIKTPQNPRTRAEWFDVTAFTAPAQGTFGNSGRNILTGPRYQNFDLSLLKGFHWTEARYLEIRVEAFNALNHPNFFGPNSDISSGGRGTITGAAAPRILQGGAKIYF